MKRILLLAVTFILVACMASAAMAKLPIFFNGPVNVISPNGSVITESMVLEIVFSDKFPNLFSGALYIGCCEWDVTGVVNDDGKYWIVSEDLIMKATPNVSLKAIIRQGPHQGAQKSTSTGSVACKTSD